MTAVTVGNTATLIVAANSKRGSLIIANNGAITIYVGDSTVATATGIPIAAGCNLTEDSGSNRMFCGDIYGICDSSCNVRYWERLTNA